MKVLSLIWILMLVVLLGLMVSCGDDDDDTTLDASDDDTADDDDSDDDTADDDVSDDDDDDTTDDDDDDDDNTPEPLIAMRPVDLDGQPGKEILYWKAYEDSGFNYSEFQILDMQNQPVYISTPKVLGTSGAAIYRIVELDGRPPAEIVAIYETIDLTTKGITYSGRAEILQGPDFDNPVFTFGPVSDALVWPGSLFDINNDGMPEFTLETRPVSELVTGQLIFYDMIDDQIALTIPGGLGEGVEVYGAWDNGGFQKAAPMEDMEGDRFLVAYRTLVSDGHLEVQSRDIQNPLAPGQQIINKPLAYTSAYFLGFYDHDDNGQYETFAILTEPDKISYFYGDRFAGQFEACSSVSGSFAGDLDNDGRGDFVLTGSSCDTAKGSAGKMEIFYSEDFDLPETLITGEVGSLKAFWYSPAYKPHGLSPVVDSPQPGQFGLIKIDHTALNLFEINLYGPDGPLNSAWVSGELTPAGNPVTGAASIGDYTGDGLLDVTAYVVSNETIGRATTFHSAMYLFRGPDMEQLFFEDLSLNYWTLGARWDYNEDGALDWLMQRSFAGPSSLPPKLRLVIPSDGFATELEIEEINATSLGLVGRYYGGEQ